MNKTAEQALDAALQAAFPDTDQGHPQNAHTWRVASIMVFVAARLAEDGFDVTYYNFHDLPDQRRVDFNQRQNEGGGVCSVAARCIPYRDLQVMTDAALIERTYQVTRADLRGEWTISQRGSQ